MIDFRELVKAGVHFGHQTSKWRPEMAPYIHSKKNGVHLFDVSKTAFQLEKAAVFLQVAAAEGKQVLWVGTKRSAQASIKECAAKVKMPYVSHRWIGGTLSNYSQFTTVAHISFYLLTFFMQNGEAQYKKLFACAAFFRT